VGDRGRAHHRAQERVLLGLAGALLGNEPIELTCQNLLEADEISLEATVAKIVRGKRVIIGPECRIDRIEYAESLQIDPKSAVKEQVRV
jgi:hypothetical protein